MSGAEEIFKMLENVTFSELIDTINVWASLKQLPSRELMIKCFKKECLEYEDARNHFFLKKLMKSQEAFVLRTNPLIKKPSKK